MKNVYLFFIATLLSGCFFSSSLSFSEQDIQDKTNLLYNGDFEITGKDSLGSISGWINLDNGFTNYDISYEDYSEGSHSLKVINPYKRVSFISEPFDIYSGAAYLTLSQIKTQNKTKKKVELYFFAFDETGNKLNSFRSDSQLLTSWTQVSLNSAYFKKNAKFGRVMIVLPADTGNVFWIDNLRLYKAYDFKK